MSDQQNPADVTLVLPAVTAGLAQGGESRHGQLQMAQAVQRASAAGRHLVVQAGTGTGKSLAYLVPSVLSGKKVVVATATKALQDQLANKDLPFLAKQLGEETPFTFAVLKGRSNYLCLQRAAEVMGGSSASSVRADEEDSPVPPISTQLHFGSSEEPTGTPTSEQSGGEGRGPKGIKRESSKTGNETPAANGRWDELSGLGEFGEQIRRLIAWSETSSSGDRAELEFEPHPRAWAAVSVSSAECPGAFRCPSGATCFTEQARARAAAADVVVVNTHLYATHVASDGAVLPEHDLLILDEAHEVEEVMAAGLGVELTAGRLRALASGARSLLKPEDAATAEGVASVADRIEAVLIPLAGSRVLRPSKALGTDDDADVRLDPRQGLRLDPRRPDASASRPEPDGLELTINPMSEVAGSNVETDQMAIPRPLPKLSGSDQELLALLELAGGRVQALAGALRRAEQSDGDGSSQSSDTSTRRTRALLAAGNMTTDIAALATTTELYVVWVEAQGTGGRNPVLRSAPIEVGPLLAQRLWPNVTAVLTSATIPPQIGSRLGLPEDHTDRLDVGSPFPYERSALLYCPTHLPDRRGPDAEVAIHDELERLILAAGGRTLALFTSWRAMDSAVEALRARLPYRVLAQSDLPKSKLIEEFGGEESACLFATLSFWQGVDVPGATLSLVTIDRLPFPRPDDPVLQARRDLAGDGAFRVVDLPRASTLLAQGVGRLIRSAGDTGVVAVLDRRLATAGYRRTLISSLPPMRFTTDPDDPVAFLQQIAGTLTGGHQ